MSQDEEQVAKCPQCGGPLRPYHEGPLRGHRLQWQRCDYCGYYVKEGLVEELKEAHQKSVSTVGTLATVGIELLFLGLFLVIVVAILGVFQNTPNLWPANQTAIITGNLQGSIKFAMALLPILFGIAGIMVVIGIFEHGISSSNSKEDEEDKA